MQFYVILKLFEDYLRILHNKISFDSCAPGKKHLHRNILLHIPI